MKWHRPAQTLAAYQDRLIQVNALAAGLGRDSDAELRQRADRLRAQVRAGLPLSDAAVQVLALVREAASRTIGLRPFDVQIIGGLALHAGKIVQMQTGEGKTLTAVAPVVLNALPGQGVHVLTFNDYLARRDAEWMGPVYRFMGLSVGSVQEGMPPHARRQAYQADVTYVTAKEAGFDYLRDGLALDPGMLVHRPFHMALVDEADSILIDEARIPLVIAGNSAGPEGEPERLAAIVQQLGRDEDYVVDRERGTVHLTERGTDRAEALLDCSNLYSPENLQLLAGVNAALYAAALMQRDVDYIVRRGRVEIVDEFTGRVVEDRHWPDGLQAAIEAKESLARTAPGQVLGQITLQHYVLQYPRLCGMTATAEAAADELQTVYGLDVQIVPPNRPCIRADYSDLIFTHKAAKQRAVVEEVVRVHTAGRPVLVGTLTVVESEQLADSLRQAGVPCNILNAKRDDQEARIVAEAGRLGAVTISTNMAGRGTDIRLGGADGREADQVAELGGLYIIGANRHESRRVDDQLRGRAGRQGDPGSSRFFISLEDDLLQQAGIGEIVSAGRFRLSPQWEPVDNPVLARQIVHAQKVVEGRNGDIRQGLWYYSNLIEQQRRIVYARRRRMLMGEARPEILPARVPAAYERAAGLLGLAAAIDLERRLTLQAIDQCWADHLADVAEIKEGIHLVTISGRSPIDEFHKLAVHAFDRFFDSVADQVVDQFAALRLTADAVDLEAAGLRGPSSTWTYLVEEQAYQDPLAAILISQSRIGLAAGIASTGPLLLLWALVRRFGKRRE